MNQKERAERERRFWDRYIKIINDQGIKQPYDRWHVRRAEEFIRAFPDRKLSEVDAVRYRAPSLFLGNDLTRWAKLNDP